MRALRTAKRFERARSQLDLFQRGMLDRAIDAYRRGRLDFMPLPPSWPRLPEYSQCLDAEAFLILIGVDSHGVPFTADFQKYW